MEDPAAHFRNSNVAFNTNLNAAAQILFTILKLLLQV